MYYMEIRGHLDRAFRKLAKKDSRQMEAVAKKVQEIAEDPHDYKPLRFPLAGLRRIHVGSYVQLFSINEARKTIVLEDHEHRNRVYRKR